MKFNQYRWFLLIFLLPLIFGACNKPQKADQKDTSKVVTYGRYWTGINEFMNMIAIPRFEAETGLTVDMTVYDKTTQTLDRVLVETRHNDQTADFIWIDLKDINAYLHNDLLVDISDLVEPFADQIPKKILDLCRGSDGKIYAVPHNLSIDLMMYNENKIDPKDLPETYEELLQWCQQNPNRYSYRGKGPHLVTSLMNFFYAFGALEYGQDISRFFDPEVNPKIVDVFEYLVELNKYTKQPHPHDVGTMDLELANELLWLFSNWDSHVASTRKNKNAPYIRLHPKYNLEGRSGLKPICLGGWLFAIPKNAANVDNGKKFVQWIMSEEMQIAAIGDSTRTFCGHIPARMDATANMPEYMKAWFDVTDVEKLRDDALRHVVVRPTWANYYESFASLVQLAHTEIIIKGEPIEDVLQNMQSELDFIVESSTVTEK